MSDEMVDYEVPGIIKAVLDALGIDAQKHREGPYNWLIPRGSALIDLAYHTKSGLIIGDAILCKIPSQNRTPLYKYLLAENNRMEVLSFSIKDEQVILSLLIYDRHINAQQGTKLLQSLLEKADHYDDILVDEYGGSWLNVPDDEVI